MPTYDYECAKCGKTFEIHQSMSEQPLTDCPACKAKGKLKRLIGSGAGIIFKGSGFYQTDYKNAKKEKTEASGASKSESQKSDAPSTPPAGSGGCGSGCGCSKH